MAAAAQVLLTPASKAPCINVNQPFHVLGPFQIGTREAPWGADPLEAYAAGFHSLKIDNATYPSSLAPDASVTWEAVNPVERQSDESALELLIDYHPKAVDWKTLQGVYGWAALQYQAWVRGEFTVSNAQSSPILLNVNGAIEYWIDGDHYFGGDLFSFARAPVVLHLGPGRHTFECRLIRDVRAMGATQPHPSVEVLLKMTFVDARHLAVDDSHTLISHVVNGLFVSEHASISVTNLGSEDISISDIDTSGAGISTELLTRGITLKPGQTRPIAFTISQTEPLASHAQLLPISVVYQTHGSSVAHLLHKIRVRHVREDEFMKITYLRPGDIVSCSMLRRPSGKVLEHPHAALPVFLKLHGAGLEVDAEELLHSLDGVIDLPYWFLIPSGTTSWGGDDWHHWAWLDVISSLQSLQRHIERNEWSSRLDLRGGVMLAGHSNGGQGAYYVASHWPDMCRSVAAVAGYLSIQKYVPYSFWTEADPEKTAVVQAVLGNFRNELLASNFATTPLHIQHGSADDNVPTYHSRRMVQTVFSSHSSLNYTEIQGKGHWFDGIMTTDELKRFYNASGQDREKPEPRKWSLQVITPAESGPKFGLKVDSLIGTGSIGSVNVRHEPGAVYIRTRNIQLLTVPQEWQAQAISVTIDGQHVFKPIAALRLHLRDGITWHWSSQEKEDFRRISSSKLGSGLNAFLNTEGRFAIVATDPSTHAVAGSIARNLYQYYAADVMILHECDDLSRTKQGNNLILMGIGKNHGIELEAGFPIQIQGNAVTIVTYTGRHTVFTASEYGDLGAAFLTPHENGALTLIIWGSSLAGLERAARLAPTFTGAGVPDFVIVNKETAVSGVQGALAMGFFDSDWQISAHSYV